MPERNRWGVVVGLGLLVFMATLDATAVAIALPAIERGYGVTTTVTEWVVLGYLLPLIAVSLPAGRWLDGVGLRGALVFGTAGFGLSSLAAGLAPWDRVAGGGPGRAGDVRRDPVRARPDDRDTGGAARGPRPGGGRDHPRSARSAR